MANIDLVIAQICTDWEAAIPADRTNVRYQEVDGKWSLDGTASDRQFYFEFPARIEPIGEFGSSYSTIAWRVQAKLRLSDSGRSQRAQRIAATSEGNALMRLVEQRSSWPLGTWEVITEDVECERDESGDSILTLNFQITTTES